MHIDLHTNFLRLISATENLFIANFGHIHVVDERMGTDTGIEEEASRTVTRADAD